MKASRIIEITFWFLFAGICYRLREFGDIWSQFNIPAEMNSDWWLGETPELPWWTFQLWRDSYHFFGNLARISISARLVIYNWKVGLAAISAWYLGEYLTKLYILN